MDIVSVLVDLAAAQRVARIEYFKLGARSPTVRFIEPYDLLSSEVSVVRCFETDPEEGTGGWRNLRLDRIASVADAGRSFTPRRQITIGDGGGAGSRHEGPVEVRVGSAGEAAADHAAAYRQALERCIVNGMLSTTDLQIPHVTAGLSDEQRRAVHARVFASALNEAALDGIVTESEVNYLHQIREFLQGLGWSP